MWHGVRFGSCHGRNDEFEVRIRISVRWNKEKTKLKLYARSHVPGTRLLCAEHAWLFLRALKRSFFLVLIGYTVNRQKAAGRNF
jgi:hypothetical protein